MTEAKRSKPTYNMAQNALYMVRLAWGKRKTVLWFCLILALLHVCISLTELFLPPLVLGKVETAAPLWELVATIAAMAVTLAVLRGVQAYIREVDQFGKVELRMELNLWLTLKAVTTSYPNASDPALRKEQVRAKWRF